MERELIIVPNKDILKIDNYYDDLKSGENHTKLILKYLNSLGLVHNTEDYTVYPGITAAMFRFCTICLNNESNFNTIYLPDEISQNQYVWFQEAKKFLEEYKYALSFSVVNLKGITLFESKTNAKDNFSLLYKKIDESLKR